VTAHDPKAVLKNYLQGGRETLVWKLDGLTEYDIRRPMVPTGTNLLGLIKHNAHSEYTYFGSAFGRAPTEPSRLQGDGEPNTDKWATADESRREIVELYRRAWSHSDATIDALTLDAVGQVPHWPVGNNEITLHEALIDVIVDTQRHAGHADILRELIDGTVGLLEGNSNMPRRDQQWWDSYRDRLESAADAASRK
jgi:hypothetical protein